MVNIHEVRADHSNLRIAVVVVNRDWGGYLGRFRGTTKLALTPPRRQTLKALKGATPGPDAETNGFRFSVKLVSNVP